MIAGAFILVAGATQSSLPECDRMAPHSLVISCFERAAASSRAKVEEAFQRILKAAKKADLNYRRFEGRVDVSLQDYLNRSQSAWIEYSDKQCLLEGGTSRGGSGTDDLNARCHYRMNRRRLSDLKTALQLIDR